MSLAFLLGSHNTSYSVLSFSIHHLDATITKLLCEFLLIASLVVRNLGQPGCHHRQRTKSL